MRFGQQPKDMMCVFMMGSKPETSMHYKPVVIMAAFHQDQNANWA